MRILRIEFENVPLFETCFSVDFAASRNVSRQDREKLYRLTDKLWLNPMISLTGLNASGKTTLLKLIVLVLKMMNSVPLNQIDQRFALHLRPGDSAEIRVFFQNGNDIWLLDSRILRQRENGRQFIFENEELKKFTGGINKPKKLMFDLSCYKTESVRKEISDFLTPDGSMIVQFNNRMKSEIPYSDYMNFTNHNQLMIIRNFPAELLSCLDPSIEYLKFDVEEKSDTEIRCEKVRLKFFDSEEIIMPSPDFLERFLSSGTIKGLGLYVSALDMMMKGGYLIVDELENHFNAQIAASLIRIFLDPEINVQGGTLVFSTHYPLLIDESDRNDCIYILRHREDVTVTRLDQILSRKDIKKSEALISGYLEGTAPDYLAYRNLARELARRGRNIGAGLKSTEVMHG